MDKRTRYVERLTFALNQYLEDKQAWDACYALEMRQADKARRAGKPKYAELIAASAEQEYTRATTRAWDALHSRVSDAEFRLEVEDD